MGHCEQQMRDDLHVSFTGPIPESKMPSLLHPQAMAVGNAAVGGRGSQAAVSDLDMTPIVVAASPQQTPGTATAPAPPIPPPQQNSKQEGTLLTRWLSFAGDWLSP